MFTAERVLPQARGALDRVSHYRQPVLRDVFDWLLSLENGQSIHSDEHTTKGRKKNVRVVQSIKKLGL
jgi:hypothetical protein